MGSPPLCPPIGSIDALSVSTLLTEGCWLKCLIPLSEPTLPVAAVACDTLSTLQKLEVRLWASLGNDSDRSSPSPVR